MVDDVTNTLGPIDLLVNNAGIFEHGPTNLFSTD